MPARLISKQTLGSSRPPTLAVGRCVDLSLAVAPDSDFLVNYASCARRRRLGSVAEVSPGALRRSGPRNFADQGLAASSECGDCGLRCLCMAPAAPRAARQCRIALTRRRWNALGLGGIRRNFCGARTTTWASCLQESRPCSLG